MNYLQETKKIINTTEILLDILNDALFHQANTVECYKIL